MKNFESINVTPEVRRCFEKANMMTVLFDDTYVRSAYVMMSILFEKCSMLNKTFDERGIITNPDYIVTALISDKEYFKAVFGQKAADKYFNEEDESEQIQENINLVENEAKAQETQSKFDPGFKNIWLKITSLGKNKKTELEEIKDEEFDNEQLKNEVVKALTEILIPISDMEDSIKIQIVYSDKLQAICEDAATRCLLAKQNYLDIDNLTYSILQNKNSSGYKMLKVILEPIGVDLDDIIESIIQNGNIHTKFGDEKKSIVIPKNLESCCTVWNDKFKAGVTSDILGRDKEIFKLWNIFSKKTKRNAILLGEAGVGKTAIVEAMVQQIVNGTCPERFKNYTVLELDVGGTVAGTKYRGELEEKLAKLKKFLENTPNLILFIDEIHQLIGAGSTESSGFDMSGSLKPILARGDVVCVGATTTAEYEKFIAKEQAFKRRFEPVIVEEPKHKDVAKMIKAKVESLSKFHGVTLEEGLVDYIIVCASAFNLSGSNPDKSIDLCDRSMAIAEMRNSKVVEKKDVDKVYEENYKKFNKWTEERRKILAYHEAGHYVMSRITSIKNSEEVIAVSIVPGQNFLGAYIYDSLANVIQPTYECYYDKLKGLLAGRIAQKLFCNAEDDAGASSDIDKVNKMARNIVASYALSPESSYKNVSLDVNKDLYNEELKGIVFKEIANIIKKATEDTEKMLKMDHIKPKVENVANLLLEKKIATAKELEEAFNKVE